MAEHLTAEPRDEYALASPEFPGFYRPHAQRSLEVTSGVLVNGEPPARGKVGPGVTIYADNERQARELWAIIADAFARVQK